MSTPQNGSVLYSTRKEMILSELKTIVNKLTGMHIGSIDVHTSFLEVGIDSLLLIQATQLIQDVFAAKLSVVQLLEEHDTIEKVATYLDQQLPVEAWQPPEIRTDKKESVSTSPMPRAIEARLEEQALNPSPGLEDQRDHSNPADAGVPTNPHGCGMSHTDLDPPRARAISTTLVHSAVRPSESPRGVSGATGNGGGPKPASISLTGDASALEHIMSQQLLVMSQQLEMLRGSSMPDLEDTTDVEAVSEACVAMEGTETPHAAIGPNETVVALPPTPTACVLPEPSDDAPILEPRPITAGSQTIQPELYVPFQPIDTSAATGLTPRQQQHLNELIKSYTSRTRESKRLTQTYRRYLADSRVSAGYRTLWKEMVYQIVGQRSQGSRIWDVDGNEYVDITMGFGLHLFGHSPAFIVQAIESQLKQGIHLGPQSHLAGKVAQMISEMTGVERVNFCNSGTEAVMGALRVARTVTRRNKIALFGGAYHGWSDGTLVRPIGCNGVQKSVPMAPGVPPLSVQDTVVLEWDSPKSLEYLREHVHELAAVITEPVQSRRPDIQPREFLHELRRLTEQSGTALILDEMVTGFRIQPGGAQAHFGVSADLVIYGKVLGGGLPIGVVAGKAAFMDAFDGGMWNYEDNSYPRAEKTLFAGAYFKHPLTMSVAEAILGHMKNDGRAEIERLNQRTSRLVEALNEFFDDQQVPIRAANFGSLFRLLVSRDFKYSDVLFYHLVENGVFVWEGRNCFLSAAHTEDDVELIIGAVKRSVLQTREGGFLPDGPTGGGPVKKSEITSTGSGFETGSRNESSAAIALPVASSPAPAKAVVTNPTEAARRLPRRRQPAAGSAIVTEPAMARSPISVPRTNTGMDFSLYFFGNYPREFDEAKYELIFKAAKYADRNGFAAIWIPERHFNSFGGFSPNPSILASALARETERIHLRAGSCVVPLHNPVRIAEEWAVVDNLSNGRAGISFASGWHSNDFIFAPDVYENRRKVMYESIDVVRRLWRGEALDMLEGKGGQVSIRVAPLPKQPELPFWLTSASLATALNAAKLGGGFLTNLQDQTIDELGDKIRLYREALEQNGFDPLSGHVAVLLHTYITDDLGRALQKSRGPFTDYLRSSFALRQNRLKNRPNNQGPSIDLERISEADSNFILSAGFERYLQVGALIGTPETCKATVERIVASGVNEVGCLIDWGLDTDSVMESLSHVNEIRKQFQRIESTESNQEPSSIVVPASTDAVAEDIAGRGAGPYEIQSSSSSIEANTPSDSGSDAPNERRSEGAYDVPLTDAARELWIATQMGDDASRAYNECIVLRLRGSLHLPAIKNALQNVVNRHEALRATFSPDGDFQRIWPTASVELPVIDFSFQDESTRESSAEARIRKEIDQPFDLAQGPLVRFRVLKLRDDENLLLISNHHLAADGQSWAVIMRDLHAFYAAERQGTVCELPTPTSVGEYVRQQSILQESPRMAECEAYWLDQFSDGAPLLELPTDRPRPMIQTYNGDQQRLTIDSAMSNELKKVSVQQGSTMLMLLLAAYGVLLHRLSTQDEMVMGIASAGQLAAGDRNIVGYCVNMLPLRSRITPGLNFSTYLRSIKRLLMGGYEHQNYSFGKLIDKLGLRGDPSRSPLFSAAFDLERTGPVMKFFDLEAQVLLKPTVMTRFDLHFVVTQTADELVLQCTYNKDLFDIQTIRRWMEHYHTLLEGIILSPERPIIELPLLNESQRQELAVEWNDTGTTYSSDDCLHSLFEAQVERTPDRVALTHEDEQLTYDEFNRRSNRLAHYLKQFGIHEETCVGVLLDRSIDLAVAVMAVLKAGAAYVPLDSSYPRERLSLMLESAGAKVLLTSRALADRAGETGAKLVCLDEDQPRIALNREDNPGNCATPHNLAYVIYTSGSTGNPKGVMISHYSIVNRILWMLREILPMADQRLLQKTSVSFDASVWEFFVPLLAGAQLVLARHGGQQDSAYLLEAIRHNSITTLQLVPTMLKVLLEEPELSKCRTLQQVFCGGEVLPLEVQRRFYERLPWIELHNLYGPTEVSIDATHWTCREAETRVVPLGRPLANARIFVLNGQQQVAPVGIAGDIHVGGRGLARGYLGQPAMTAERFVPDSLSGQRGERLYETGDLGRWRPEGVLEYLGRVDYQVKVRGFRIEIGEIDTALRQVESVRDATTVAGTDTAGGIRLIAYVTLNETFTTTVTELRERLLDKLPEYMVPGAFVILEKMPLMASGKIDRSALPIPDDSRPQVRQDYVAPRNQIENLLADIWAEVLGIDPVGIQDRFLELGGHSLLAIQLISRIRQSFKVKVGIRTLFESTVAGLAEIITAMQIEAAEDKTAVVGGSEIADVLDGIERLSERDVDALLTSMLAEQEAR